MANCIAAGAHPKQMQEEAGHSSITTTMNVYGHIFEAMGEKVADAMEEMHRAALEESVKVTQLR